MIGDSRSGLLASLRRLLISGSELAEVRLQLLATELQQEKLRLLESLAWLVVAAMACCVGLLLFSLFVVLLVEPAHRLLALGVLSLAFLVGAGLAWRMALRRQQAGGAPFEASLDELRRDRAALGAHDPSASR